MAPRSSGGLKRRMRRGPAANAPVAKVVSPAKVVGPKVAQKAGPAQVVGASKLAAKMRPPRPKTAGGDSVVGLGTNTGSVAKDTAGKSYLTGITKDGRISHVYGDGGKRKVLNEQQTLAEMAKLPPAIRAEVRKRLKRATATSP